MASHSIILKGPEEARLEQLYQTKCDEVSPKHVDISNQNPILNSYRKVKWFSLSSFSLHKREI